jgi:hypothetical protein
MTKARGLLIVGLLLCAKPSYAAEFTLPSWDGMTWTAQGIASIVDSFFVPPVGPTIVSPSGDASDFLLLESGHPGQATAAELETFFNFSTPNFLTSEGYVTGSGAQFTFTPTASGAFSFDYRFLSTEDPFTPPPNADASWFLVDGDGILIQQTTFALQDVSGTSGPVFDFVAGTEYTIGFGVFNKTFDAFSTYFAVDGLRIADAPVGQLQQSVPEPGTLLLLTAGWGTAFVSRRFFGAPKKRVA